MIYPSFPPSLSAREYVNVATPASANIHYRYRVNHHIADLGRDGFDLGFIWSILLGQMGFQQT